MGFEHSLGRHNNLPTCTSLLLPVLISSLESDVCYFPTTGGMDYMGKVARDKDGVPCQRWSATYPHVSAYMVSTYPHVSFYMVSTYPHVLAYTVSTYPHVSAYMVSTYPHVSSYMVSTYPHVSAYMVSIYPHVSAYMVSTYPHVSSGMVITVCIETINIMHKMWTKNKRFCK